MVLHKKNIQKFESKKLKAIIIFLRYQDKQYVWQELYLLNHTAMPVVMHIPKPGHNPNKKTELAYVTNVSEYSRFM